MSLLKRSIRGVQNVSGFNLYLICVDYECEIGIYALIGDPQ